MLAALGSMAAERGAGGTTPASAEHGRTGAQAHGRVSPRRKLAELARQRDAARAELAAARRREATLARANRDLKRAAFEEATATSVPRGDPAGKTERRFLRDREALERARGADPADGDPADGLRVAEAALATALAELTK